MKYASCAKNSTMRGSKKSLVSITEFPCEILLIIFGYLGHLDLKNVLLVCMKWKMMAEDPNLWSDCELILNQENKDDLEECLDLKRFSKVHTLKFYKANLNCQDFIKISNSRLKFLNMQKCNLKGVQAKDLSKCVNSLEKVDFDHSRTSSFQLKCLLTSITEETHLKYLDLSDMDLSNIDPYILGQAVNTIEEVHLGMEAQASLTTNQLTAIFALLDDVHLVTTHPSPAVPTNTLIH